MTFTLDITLILEVLLFLIVLTLAVVLLWPSRKPAQVPVQAKEENKEEDTEQMDPVPTQTVINHYHYVITVKDGKEVAEEEMDSDADTDNGGLYDVSPDDGSWTRDDLHMLRSLADDKDEDSRRRKIDRLIGIGLVEESKRESLMTAVVDVKENTAVPYSEEVTPEMIPETTDDFGNPIAGSPFEVSGFYQD